MPEKRRLTPLAERRRLLVLEADLQRGIICLEREKLRAQFAGLQSMRMRAFKSPLLIAGGAMAGLFAARHKHKLARWILTAMTVIGWLQRPNRT
jgi:hypothetical protein